MPLTISTFRDYAENLGRFASARERKAQGPKDTASHKHQPYPITWSQDEEGNNLEHRPQFFVCKSCTRSWSAEEINRQYDPTDAVLIQATNGVLKLVAGTADSTLIIDAGPTSTSGKALVASRLLLNAAKSLRGKGEVDVEITNEGATIRVSTGAEMQLPNVAEAMPDWTRVPKADVPAVPFPEGFWADASKVFAATTANYWPYSYVHAMPEGQRLVFLASDRKTLGKVGLDGPEVLPAEYAGSISSVFTGALRGIDGAGTARLYAGNQGWPQVGGNGAFWIVAGPYTAVTRLLPARAHNPEHPMLNIESDTEITIDKKVFVDMVKSVGSADEYDRITLLASRGSLTIRSYPDLTTSIKAPAKVAGDDGQITVAGDLLARLLAAHPGKQATLGWAAQLSPIRLIDRAWPWQLYLAPVVQ